MVCYIDSSFLLSAILEERSKAEHAVWEDAAQRLSSDLLRFECAIAMRRAAALQPADTAPEWLRERMKALDRVFRSITFKAIDESVERIVRQEQRFEGCRTLDAIHVATAMFLAPHAESPLTICTFDRRLWETARGVGLAVWPAAAPPA